MDGQPCSATRDARRADRERRPTLKRNRLSRKSVSRSTPWFTSVGDTPRPSSRGKFTGRELASRRKREARGPQLSPVETVLAEHSALALSSGLESAADL